MLAIAKLDALIFILIFLLRLYIGNSGRDALYELILLRLLYRDDIGSSAPSLLALTYLGNLNYL